jgi:hypothetical protein
MDYPEDMIKQFERAYSSVQVHVPVRYAETTFQPDVMNSHLYIRANTIPLLSGCLAGFNKDMLSTIAQGHGICAQAFILTFSAALDIQRLDDTNRMSGREVFRRCFEGLELAAHDQIRAIYDKPKISTPFYMMAITTAASPKLWPKTILSEYIKASEANLTTSAAPFSVEVHNFLGALKNEHQLPWDAAGPRYDWFLDRSGMLLPAVTNKSLGYFMLWEQLVYQSSQPGDTPIHRLMDYCVDNPPESLRPGILNGFRSLSMQAAENMSGGTQILNFLTTRLKGSWLEPILKSDILKLNLLGLTRVSYEWEDKEALSQSVFNEILATPTPSIGFAQFIAIFLPRAVHGQHRLDPDFNRERFLVHLLNGMQCFIGAGKSMSDGTRDIQEDVINNCRRAIQQLSTNHQFDYNQFLGLQSSGIRLLIEEGFDRRLLPKMVSADRGRLLEDEIGL